MDNIIKFLKDLNDFETAIAIILAFAIPIIVFLLRKISSKKISPSIKINKQQQGIYDRLEIYNNGNEALVDLKININGSPQRVMLIKIDEDQMFATPHYSEVIAESEHKLIIDLPKKGTIKLSAKGAKSQKTLQVEEFFDFSDQGS